MKVVIYTNQEGFAIVTVEGNDTDTPTEVARAYKIAKEELEKEDNPSE